MSETVTFPEWAEQVSAGIRRIKDLEAANVDLAKRVSAIEARIEAKAAKTETAK